MPELPTPAFPCSSFAFPNIPLKFSPHSPVQKTVIGKPIQGILLFRRKQVINLLPRLAGTDGLYDFSYLHVFPELIYFCNTHIGTSSPRGTSSARYIPEGTVLPPRKGQCRTSGIYACTNAPFHDPKSFGTVRDSSSWQLPSPSVDARNWNR